MLGTKLIHVSKKGPAIWIMGEIRMASWILATQDQLFTFTWQHQGITWTNCRLFVNCTLKNISKLNFVWSSSILIQGNAICKFCSCIICSSTRGPFRLHGLTLISALIGDYRYIKYKGRPEIIEPFPNSNCAAVEVWEWRSNFIINFTVHVITYPCWV